MVTEQMSPEDQRGPGHTGQGLLSQMGMWHSRQGSLIARWMSHTRGPWFADSSKRPFFLGHFGLLLSSVPLESGRFSSCSGRSPPGPDGPVGTSLLPATVHVIYTRCHLAAVSLAHQRFLRAARERRHYRAGSIARVPPVGHLGCAGMGTCVLRPSSHSCPSPTHNPAHPPPTLFGGPDALGLWGVGQSDRVSAFKHVPPRGSSPWL